MTEQPFVAKVKQALEHQINALRDAVSHELDSGADTAPGVPAGGSSVDDLYAGFQRLSEATSQVDLLTQLVGVASDHAARVVLFILKHDQLYGWAARGFEDAFTAGVKRVKWNISDYAELTRVVRRQEGITLNFSDLSDIGDEISEFDGFVPLKSCFYPLRVRGKVAAVLYADSGSQPNLSQPRMLEMLAYFAGHELTLITLKLKKKAEHHTKDVSEPVAQKPIDVPTQPQPQPEQQRPRRASIVDDGLPQTPEFKPAHPEPQPPPEPTAPATDDASDPKIKKAKRVARVLVSDIKLYNEDQVAKGQQEGNLYQHLREDIDRSYSHFKERTADIAPPGTNYFKDELIRQLADGDASLFGDLPF